MKKYITQAYWSSNNEIRFAIASQQYAFKRYEWLISEVNSLLPELLDIKESMRITSQRLAY